MTPTGILIRARDLIPTADDWCKGTLEDGEGRHCLYGALMMAAHGVASVHGMPAIRGDEPVMPVYRKAEELLILAARRRVGGMIEPIGGFNNRVTTRHEDVLDLLDEVILESGLEEGVDLAELCVAE